MTRYYSFLLEFMDEFKVGKNNFNSFMNISGKIQSDKNPNINAYNKEYNKQLYANKGSAIGSIAGIVGGIGLGNMTSNKLINKQCLNQLKSIVFRSDDLMNAYKEYRTNLYQQIPRYDKVFRKQNKNDPQWKDKILKRINIELAGGTALGSVGGAIAGRYIGKAIGNTVGGITGNFSNNKNLTHNRIQSINQISDYKSDIIKDTINNYDATYITKRWV